jgi:hypothetical protein
VLIIFTYSQLPSKEGHIGSAIGQLSLLERLGVETVPRHYITILLAIQQGCLRPSGNAPDGNGELASDIIDWVNHWNIGEEDVVHGPMRVAYSERKQMVEIFLEFS